MENNVIESESFKLLAILKEYSTLPEYSGLEMIDVNTISLFGDYPINIAATRGVIDEIRILLGFGADINTKGEHGYTPLHNAIEQGHINVVKFLLKNGADKNISNTDGDSALALSTLLNEEKMVALLSE